MPWAWWSATKALARATMAMVRRAAAVWLLLWLVPVLALLVTLGPDATFSRIAMFFSEMAVVTFGGAYAGLAYVAQQAVEHYHWLRPGEMLDVLGMAEATPGPLIMVTQFVGFMAAYRDPGALHPMVAGTLGGLLTTWVTFTPCFLWIFLGAPFIEGSAATRRLAGAVRHYGRRGRRHPEPRGVVCAAHLVPRSETRPEAGHFVRPFFARQPRSLGARALGRGCHCDLQVQGRDDSGATCLRGRRRGVAFPRGVLMKRRALLAAAWCPAGGVNFAAGIPTIWLNLVAWLTQNPTRDGNGRRAPPEALLRQLRNLFGVRILHTWGITEISPITTMATLLPEQAGLGEDEMCAQLAKQGRTIFGCDVRLVDPTG